MEGNGSEGRGGIREARKEKGVMPNWTCGAPSTGARLAMSTDTSREPIGVSLES